MAPEDWAEEVPEVVMVANSPGVTEMVQELHLEFDGVFSDELSSEPARVEPMRIKLIENAVLPPPCRVKKTGDVVAKFISESVEKLKKNGFIVRSESPVASRVVVVRAADRDWRFCIDLQAYGAECVPVAIDQNCVGKDCGSEVLCQD